MARTTVSDNTAVLIVSLENRRLANKKRMLEYYGLIVPSFSDALRIKKMENQQRRLHYYGLQSMDWMMSCKTQNQKMRCQYYGLGDNRTSSGIIQHSALDSSKPEKSTGAAFNFEEHCKEIEQFKQTDWAMEMEKESVRQWEMDQLRKAID